MTQNSVSFSCQSKQDSRCCINFPQGVCKTRTGYLRLADADGKMRIEKCDGKNVDKKNSKKKKTRNVDGKKNKQTNKQRKEIFLSSRCHMVGPLSYIQNVMPIVGTVLYPVIPFINVTEIRTLRSSSLMHAYWCTSPLSV